MKKFALLTLVISNLFFCCTSNKENKPVSDIIKTVGTTFTDSLVPPVITSIPKANPPKYVKAAPPTIVQLKTPNGVGIPIITNYGTAEGLAGTFASPASTDQQGNLWFSTRNSGIFKYDGHSFANYNVDNGLTSSSISYLFIDSKNNLWIATRCV